jgi:hypothetical protein
MFRFLTNVFLPLTAVLRGGASTSIGAIPELNEKTNQSLIDKTPIHDNDGQLISGSTPNYQDYFIPEELREHFNHQRSLQQTQRPEIYANWWQNQTGGELSSYDEKVDNALIPGSADTKWRNGYRGFNKDGSTKIVRYCFIDQDHDLQKDKIKAIHRDSMAEIEENANIIFEEITYLDIAADEITPEIWSKFLNKTLVIPSNTFFEYLNLNSINVDYIDMYNLILQTVKIEQNNNSIGTSYLGYWAGGYLVMNFEAIRSVTEERIRATSIHELLHALGVGHPNDNGFDAGFGKEQTIMSYNTKSLYPLVGNKYLQAYDKNVLSLLYGVNPSTQYPELFEITKGLTAYSIPNAKIIDMSIIDISSFM